MEDHYKLLGITPAASQAEILIAYKNSLKKPMHLDDRAKMRIAFDVLSDGVSRRTYDQQWRSHFGAKPLSNMTIVGLDKPHVKTTSGPASVKPMNSYRPRSVGSEPKIQVPYSDRRSELRDAFWWENWRTVAVVLLAAFAGYLSYRSLSDTFGGSDPTLRWMLEYGIAVFAMHYAAAISLLHYVRTRRFHVFALPALIIISGVSLLIAQGTSTSTSSQQMAFSLAIAAPLLALIVFSLGAIVRFTPLGRRLFFGVYLIGWAVLMAMLFSTTTNPDLRDWMAAWVTVAFAFII